MDEPPWKMIRLSLERPYKDDNGDHILDVLDITPDGECILEPRESTSQKLGHDFSRVFAERGSDFFEKLKAKGLEDDEESLSGQSDQVNESLKENDAKKQAREHPMTTEELFQMRIEILPQLHVALGEMSHARDLLSSLLSESVLGDGLSAPTLPKGALSTTTVSKPTEIPSVRAFNSQLIVGGKDAALRKAAAAFKSAANSTERVRVRGEKYWSDALKTRNANWDMVPAPLPSGAPSGKGVDKTTHDFWITFGLAESPAVFKQRAMAHLAMQDSDESPLVFPRHQATRMRVSLVSKGDCGQERISRDTYQAENDTSLDYLLRSARNEAVDQEIFSQLIKEVAFLPTAAVSVSERLIVIEAASNSELRFELVEDDIPAESPVEQEADPYESAICDLIHSSLVLLLLRAHAFARNQRLSSALSPLSIKQRPSAMPPPLLLPVFNILQYKHFCEKVEKEFCTMEHLLQRACVPVKVRFNAVGEAGIQLVESLSGDERSRIGGEAMLRIDNRHTLRFTFLSPSNLVAHLPQATIVITSVPQLSQILKDEAERCLLDSICRICKHDSTSVEGTWFIDNLSNKCVGRWDTTLLTFKFAYIAEDPPDIICEAVEVREHLNHSVLSTYRADNKNGLLDWVKRVVIGACELRH